MFQTIHLKKLLISLGVTLGTGLLAALIIGGQTESYGAVLKPPLSPPAILFPIAWTILYICMGVALYFIQKQPENPQRTSAIRMFAAQLIANFCWPIVFFSFRAYGFAAVWLAVLIILVAWTTVLFYRQKKVAGYLMIPYLAWCCFALYLNIGVWLLN